eukprot:scaffold1525_cov142-Cylindrotheca_fusiformis.AAC.72
MILDIVSGYGGQKKNEQERKTVENVSCWGTKQRFDAFENVQPPTSVQPTFVRRHLTCDVHQTKNAMNEKSNELNKFIDKWRRHSTPELLFKQIVRMLRYFIILLCIASVHSFLFPISNDRVGRTSLNVQQRKPKKIMIKDLQKKLLKSPDALEIGKAQTAKKSRRSRKRVDNPKQTYVYAAQRAKSKTTKKMDDGADESEQQVVVDENSPFARARELGLVNAANQHCEAPVDDVEPVIVGQIRVGDGNGSDAYAYLIDKPAGWSILGRTGGSKKNQTLAATTSKKEKTPKNNLKRVKIKSDDGKDEILAFNEDDVLDLLTPEERAEYKANGGPLFDASGVAYDDTDLTPYDIPGWDDVANMTPEQRAEAGTTNEDYDPTDVQIPEIQESDILALMSPEEIAEYNEERKVDVHEDPLKKLQNVPRESLDPAAQENLKRIEKRLVEKKDSASFASYARPSVVSWLKNIKGKEGNPIRGGNFWTAAAGATEVDDSGLVLVCPKTNLKNVFVDLAEYIAVVGNGGFLRPISKKDTDIPKEAVAAQIVSKIRKGREGDTCQTVHFAIPEYSSTCSSIIYHAQAQFDDGIRGDPAANPFDRRSPRRLVHCSALSVSSLAHDDEVQEETTSLPDDIAIISDRLNNHAFNEGSFLGRSSLRKNPLTTAYREINGAADGFPGWTLDRYGDWLLVQHDEKEYKGPLPSIHDGKTAGVYYLPSNPSRSTMGSTTKIRPTLLEGRPAPETIPVLENGVTYHVSLDKDLSTGIFLDQRLHRAWLTRNCNKDTHVLNCFAHCGAFSIAAATAGASTVSLDLSKKWLDRVQPQLEANGIPFDERHDCIYGDCFEWLGKLAKRGEKFDIVILDPPSSSVGKKKRRWSVKNDMDELVALAAPLVKRGGLLFTTTNSASVTPVKFARTCKRGLNNVGLNSAKLERIQPMPHDFPSIGAPSVKNLVWRIPMN